MVGGGGIMQTLQLRDCGQKAMKQRYWASAALFLSVFAVVIVLIAPVFAAALYGLALWLDLVPPGKPGAGAEEFPVAQAPPLGPVAAPRLRRQYPDEPYRSPYED